MSKRIKEIQEKTLIFYKLLQPMLEKHKIDYTANGGTCIGACREKGFIEWDDDMDLNIMPYDFDKFSTLLDELPENMYWEITTQGLYKIIHKDLKSEGANIFIDFMVHSYVHRPSKIRLFMCMLFAAHYGFNGNTLGKNRFNKWYIKWPVRILTFWFPVKISKWAFLKIMKSKNNGYVAQTSFYPWWKRTYNKTTLFQDRIKIDFEDTYIYVPREYDKYLTKGFGDWKKPINYGHNHYE